MCGTLTRSVLDERYESPHDWPGPLRDLNDQTPREVEMYFILRDRGGSFPFANQPLLLL